MGILGAIIGGAIGTVIAPGWGTAIGAAIGGGAGEVLGGKNEANDIPELKLKVLQKKIDIDGEAVDVFEVQVKGTIVAPKDNTPATFLLVARDCSGGKDFKDGDIIATSADFLSSLGDGVLSPTEDVTLPYQYSEYSDWSVAFTVPISPLIFPYKGQRDIEFALIVQDKKEEALAYTSEKISYRVNEIGYMEFEKNWKESEKIALQIIRLLVANNSNYFTLDTSKIVKDWIANRKLLRDDNEQSNAERELQAEFSRIKNTSEKAEISSIVSKCHKLQDFTRYSERYTFMELFLQLTATFENISGEDVKLLDLIAQELALDDNEYQEAKHKYLPMHELDTIDPFVALGIAQSLSLAEKKKKLRELFAKWNALAVHKNPEIRKKAENMLDAIAECQKRLS